MQIVYTVSTGYSGSTLLSMLMNSHPKIASIGELANTIGHFLNRREQKSYPCSCKNDITACPFWKQVQKQCLEYGVTLDLYDFKAQLDLGFGDKINKMAFSVSNDFRFLQSCRDFVLKCIPLYSSTVNKTLDRNLIITRSILETSGKQIFLMPQKMRD